jgi:hypothetical protein
VGLSSRLQKLQNRAARIIIHLRYNTPGIEAINALGWEPLETRRAKSKVKQMYKVLNDLAPSSLATLFVHKGNITEYDLRGSSTSLQLPLPLKTLRKASVMMELNCGTHYLQICVIQIQYITNIHKCN